MKLVKGVVYEINDDTMDFFIYHNRVEYHSTTIRESDGKPMHTCIIRQSDGDIETYRFFDEEFKCVAQLQEI